ncbi:MAG: hypothetical protein JWR42_2131 [Marmoricola sp.]|nr:hypothetical protein [Marmoricola sp.]
MRSSRRIAALAVGMLLVPGLLGLEATTTGASAATASTRAPSVTPVPAPDCRPAPATPPAEGTPAPAPPTTPDSYAPRDGSLSFNNPVGSRAAKRALATIVLRSIRSSPSCSLIRIATWNLRAAEQADALKAAVDRGVTVQLIMSQGNNTAKGTDTYNPVYLDLKDYLSKHPNPRNGLSNWATTCSGACRYAGGAAHSKYYMFSQVGQTKGVVHYGSYNLTDAANAYQWNDLYTVIRPAFYTRMSDVFVQSQSKKNQSNPFQRIVDGNLSMDVYPWAPRGGDPMLSNLNAVKCTSAGKVGINGRTSIRISNAAILGQRGLALANKLVRLRRAGCNVKLVATNLGYNVIKVLRAGGVPTRQLIKYDDRLQMYVRYTHTKFMAISGNWGGRSNQQISWNGTANWTASSLSSDELVGKVTSAAVTNKYASFVNYWYVHTPNGTRLVPTTNQTDGRSSNPWRRVEQD